MNQNRQEPKTPELQNRVTKPTSQTELLTVKYFELVLDMKKTLYSFRVINSRFLKKIKFQSY